MKNVDDDGVIPFDVVRPGLFGHFLQSSAPQFSTRCPKMGIFLIKFLLNVIFCCQSKQLPLLLKQGTKTKMNNKINPPVSDL